MKTALLYICILFPIILFSQNESYSIIGQEINRSLKNNPKPPIYKPLSKAKTNSALSTVYTFKPINILKDHNELIRLQLLNFEGEELELILKRINLFQSHSNWSKQNTFRGIIKGNPNSLATLNISDQGISGIISDQKGNTILQPVDNSDHNVLIEVFKDTEKQANNWTCQNDNHSNEISEFKGDDYKQKNNDLNEISLYIECDYALYLKNGSSIEQTMNYITGVFNEVAAIYANENITLTIDDIKIWSTEDPYDSNSAVSALKSFKNKLNNNFNADLAHLISGSSHGNGGLAYINSLCNKSRGYAYSNVTGKYSNRNSYSWDVHVIAHELGHNLGSPHTHDCTWGDNNDEALDDCYSTDCNQLNQNYAGTIMSYCHLTPEGINFSKGFGQEPGDLIRSNVAECLNEQFINCYNAVSINETGTYSIKGPQWGAGAHHADAANASWVEFVPHTNGHISIKSCNQGVDTRLFIYQGNCDNLIQLKHSDDECNIGNGLNYASFVDSLVVTVGTRYFIEWDSKWSPNGFDMDFLYEFEIIEDPCNNGILDKGEQEIDCGGPSCVPCSACNNFVEPEETIKDSVEYRISGAIALKSTVLSTGNLNISSQEEIEFGPGFEMKMGAQLQTTIEGCQEYYDRISDADL